MRKIRPISHSDLPVKYLNRKHQGTEMKEQRIFVACYYFKSKQAWESCWHWKGPREGQRTGRVSKTNHRCFTASSRTQGGGPHRPHRWAPVRITAAMAHTSVPLSVPDRVLGILLLTGTLGGDDIITDPVPRWGNLTENPMKGGVCPWNSLFCNARNCLRAASFVNGKKTSWGVRYLNSEVLCLSVKASVPLSSSDIPATEVTKPPDPGRHHPKSSKN